MTEKVLTKNVLHCYCGYHKSTGILQVSASGGLATALYEFAIVENGVVYGVTYTSDFCGAEFARVTAVTELTCLQGTKYVETSKSLKDGKQLYSSIVEDLISGNEVLFVGLPCEVAALKKIINNKKIIGKLNTVDLICHGPTYSKVAREYISSLEKRYHSKLFEFSVRYKNPDWQPPYLYGKFKNGKTYIRLFNDTEYGIAFNIMGRSGCYDCKFKEENHQSDITIGDYWGIKTDHRCYNPKGVSIAIVHSQNGEEIMKSLSNFVYSEVKEDEALQSNSMYYVSRKKHPQYDRFVQVFNERGLHAACMACSSRNQKLRLLLPNKVLDLIRKIKR